MRRMNLLVVALVLVAGLLGASEAQAGCGGKAAGGCSGWFPGKHAGQALKCLGQRFASAAALAPGCMTKARLTHACKCVSPCKCDACRCGVAAPLPSPQHVTPAPLPTPQAPCKNGVCPVRLPGSTGWRTALLLTVVAQTRPAYAIDPYGFTHWLNGVRASYGLGAVGYDPSLTAWAASNNSQQQFRGMGHYVMGSARRQNSGVGNYAAILPMWLASPAHRAALLDPTIRRIGIAGLGAYWTFNAN